MRRASIAAACGALAALTSLGWIQSSETPLGPGTVRIAAGLAREGGTSIELPPLGRLRAATHRMPVVLEARVVSVDVDAAQQAASGSDPLDALGDEITADLPGALRAFVLRSLAIAAAAGAVVALLLPGRRAADALPGAIGGAVAVGVLLAGTWVPYDLEAFREPTFEGELTRVPDLITAAQGNLADLETVRSRIDTVSDRLAELYAASVGELPGGSVGETSILHVSDLHLNPLGAELVVRLATNLEVDAILDTGDVTSFGLPIEARFGEVLAAVSVPYYLVPGNHDSPANRRQLDAIEGITLLDEDTVELGGVRILGVPDPTFTADNEMSTEEARAEKLRRAGSVARVVRRAAPDVLAVHDLRQAEQSTGFVPLVVAGHLHERTDVERDGTRLLTVGSTGATGLGSFTVETSEPYEAQVLRFRDGRLVAVDYLTVDGIGGDFTLERRLVDPAEDE